MLSRQKITFWSCLLICTFFQVLPVIRSGWPSTAGLSFWGPTGHDGIWHLSLINHLHNPFKIDLPTMAGESLTNYHPFFDILAKFLASLTHLPSTLILFQILPILMAVSFLYLSFLIGGYPLMLLNTFATSLGWLFGKGETAFWAMQSPSNQLNPPFMLSLVGLSLLIYLIYRKNKLNGFHLALIFLILTFLPITKIYAAPTGFFLFFIFSLKKIKSDRRPLWILLSSLITSVVLFFIYNPNLSATLIYKPLWFVNTMFESQDRFFLPQITNIIYTLKASPYFSLRLLIVEIFGVCLFIIGNYAFRILGFLKTNKEFLFLILFNTLVPLLFIQKGTAWNTIQFLYYGLFIGNIALASYLRNKKTFLAVIIIISFIANFPIYKNYLSNPAPTAIFPDEIKALNFLHSQTPGIVLTHPYDPYLKNKFSATPLPIYAYETTAYVSAFSQQLVFLEDEMNLQILDKNYLQRRQESLAFFDQKNEFQNRGFLVNNQIDYIYLPKDFPDRISQNYLSLGIKKIFENNSVLLFSVER